MLAKYGSDWLQLDMRRSGVVYALASDVLDLPAGLADLAPTEAPRVVYVAAQAVEAAPTPAPEPYAVTNAGDFYRPPNTSIEQRQQLIGADPNALACGGSPLCGGLTNAQAQAALDAERAGR